MLAIDVHDSSQVAEARRTATALAQRQGFGTDDCGRVAIVSTELSTNLLKHGDGGALLIGSYDDETGTGVECLALDSGRGIVDVPAALRDGHSTAGSPGTGLGAVRRGAQFVDIYSAPGAGTAILARLAAGRAPVDARAAPSAFGAVRIAMRGETVCGDDWRRLPRPDRGATVMVADGLGHGPNAAEASLAAVGCFERHRDAAPGELLAIMHGALRPTRGAAVSIARIDPARGEVVFAGVGNVAAAIVDRDGTSHRLVSHNGTIGHIARHMQDFTYATGDAALLILASDGLATGWRLAAYPGLIGRHPTLIAGVLYRDFSRGRDDVTVLVCRIGPS